MNAEAETRCCLQDRHAYKSDFFQLLIEGDLLLAGFPKSGVTWLQYIVQLILHRSTSRTGGRSIVAEIDSASESCMLPHEFIGDFAPWLERHPAALSKAAGPSCGLGRGKSCCSSGNEARGEASDELPEEGSIFKTHLTPSVLFDLGSRAGDVDAGRRPAVIVIVRDIKDVCVSMWHHWRAHYASDINIEDFFNRFVAGTVDFGSVLEYV